MVAGAATIDLFARESLLSGSDTPSPGRRKDYAEQDDEVVVSWCGVIHLFMLSATYLGRSFC